MRPWWWYIGTMGGTGAIAKAPGTFGTLAAVAAVAWLPDPFYAPITLFLAITSTLLGPALARRFMANDDDDPQSFVLDEGAGFWIAALWFQHPGNLSLVLAFICFRVLDITKPAGLRHVERWTRGYGVVYDDVFAGCGAWFLVRLAEWIIVR